MKAFLGRAWHILLGGATIVIGLAGGPSGAALFGAHTSTVIVAIGGLLQTLGIIHGDRVAANAPPDPPKPT